jgi:hypothetical protein
MPSSIKTPKVVGRRNLSFNSVADIQNDVEFLAASENVRALGNWTESQIYDHLALILIKSIDGFQFMMPWVIRFPLKLFKRRFMTKPMKPGNKLPRSAEVKFTAQPRETAEALEHLRHALHRFGVEEKRAPHPFFGHMTRDETIQLQCRHCELHLSFLIPSTTEFDLSANISARLIE